MPVRRECRQRECILILPYARCIQEGVSCVSRGGLFVEQNAAAGRVNPYSFDEYLEWRNGVDYYADDPFL